MRNKQAVFPDEADIEKAMAAEQKSKRHRKRMRAVRSFLLRLFSLALVLYILLFHVVGLLLMPSGDMYPRLDAGDLLLYYRLDQHPKIQDIVVIEKAVDTDYSALTGERREKDFIRRALDWLGFRDPEDPEVSTFICRVVAAPGDMVEISDERGLAVNGNTMIESGIFYPTRAYEGHVTYPLTLGADEYFVMADFRNGGADSRFFGPVNLEEIRGILITVLRRNRL